MLVYQQPDQNPLKALSFGHRSLSFQMVGVSGNLLRATVLFGRFHDAVDNIDAEPLASRMQVVLSLIHI